MQARSLDILLKNSEKNEYHGKLGDWQYIATDEDGLDFGCLQLIVNGIGYVGTAVLNNGQTMKLLGTSQKDSNLTAHVWKVDNEHGFVTLSCEATPVE